MAIVESTLEGPWPLSRQDRDSCDEFRLLFANLPEPTWVYDVETLRILEVNRAAILKYGYSRQEFLSITIEGIRPPEDISSLRETLQVNHGTQSPAQPDVCRHRSKSGDVFEVEVASHPTVFAGREAQVVVARDIAARRQTERSLRLRYDLTRHLSEDAGDALKKALRCLCEGLQFDAAELWSVSTDGNPLCLSVQWNVAAPEAPDPGREDADATLEARSRLLADVWASGATRWITEPTHLAHWDCADFRHAPGFSSALVFAVRSYSEVNGIVVLLNRKPRQLDPPVADLVSVSLQLDQYISRRRAEEKLRQAEEDFRVLYNDAPVAYHEIDRTGHVVRVNRAECEMLGVQAADIVGRPVWEFVCPEQRETSRASVERKLHHGELGPNFERKYRGRDGVDHLCEISERLIVNAAGEITGIRTAMLDLTSSKKAQQEIAFQAALLSHVNEALVALDTDFRISYWNRAAERLFECPAEEALGKTYSEVVQSTETGPERQSIHQKILERGQWRGDLVCRKRSGGQIILEALVSVFGAEEGSPSGIVGIYHDVTLRRRTEAALLASENRFKLAQSVLAVGTWELDLATGRSTCSPQLLRVYGITEHREDFTGDDWIQLVHPDDRERILTELQVSVESGVAPDRRHRAIWPDGSVHWIVTKSHVMLDANGQPSRIIGMDFDETLQMRTEERLRFLSSAVEQSPVSIVITDLHGNIEYVNRKATEITGYSMAELVGHNPRILKSGDKSPEEYTGIWETIRTGEWRGIFHNKKKNGELFWESAAISPIRDSSGKPTHYLAVKEDITERMAIEAALKTSEERFRLITETISEVFWMSDATLTRIFYISPAYENLWGRSRESLYADPRSFMEPIHPEDLDRVRHEIESGRAAHQPFESEYRLVLPDGSTRSIRDRGFPVYDSDGRVSGYVGVALNVTDQKASEQANADLAAIVQSADSAIISKDLCGNVLTWNPGAERIFGYSAEEMIGRNITALIPADRIDEEAGIHATFLRGETTSHLETVRRTRSGNPISVLLTISPIRDGSGAVVGASQVAWNITEQKLLQRQLAQAQKLESIGQLAAGVAHEINTPIQYIGDNAKFLEEAFRDLARFVGPHREIAETFRRSREPGLAAALDRIYQEVDVDYLLEEVPKATRQLSEGVEQVARIVRAMKEFSHPGPVEKVPLDINRAIESTIVVSKNEWKYVADLTTDFDLGLPLVPSVAGEFNQVVLNLIVNAAHAIADVTKTTGGKGAIRISTRRSGEWAEVRVSDTGMGIPEAIRSNVFDPFFTTKEVGKGTGQGLSIAHAVIVKKHHGTFRFETEVGSGTTFILQLPLEASPAGETNSICL